MTVFFDCQPCGRNRILYCKGLCRSCYNRLLKYGDPAPKDSLQEFVARFWSKVEKTDDCWNWTGHIGRKGYGFVSHNPEQYSAQAHRTSWIILRGEIPGDLQLDHLCLNKRCVNPDHLEPVTNEVNGQRAKAIRDLRPTCIRGHPFDEVNTYYEKPGKRVCRTCRDESRRRFHERNPHYGTVGRSVELRSGR